MTAWARDHWRALFRSTSRKPLAEELLFGKLAKGGNVKVGIKGGKLDLKIEPPQAPRLSSKKPPLLTAE